MRFIRFQDLLAALVTIILLAAVVALALLGEQVPDFLQNAFAAALAYTFRGGMATANDIIHERRATHESGP